MIAVKIAAAVVAIPALALTLAAAVIVKSVAEIAAAEDAEERHLTVVPGAPTR